MNIYEEMKKKWQKEATQKAQNNSPYVAKAKQIVDYFVSRYGEKNAQFICSRIAQGLTKYTLQELISMGEKIALFNGWRKI